MLDSKQSDLSVHTAVIYEIILSWNDNNADEWTKFVHDSL